MRWSVWGLGVLLVTATSMSASAQSGHVMNTQERQCMDQWSACFNNMFNKGAPPDGNDVLRTCDPPRNQCMAAAKSVPAAPAAQAAPPPTPATTGRSMAEFDALMKQADACAKKNGLAKCSQYTNQLNQQFPGWQSGKPTNITQGSPIIQGSPQSAGDKLMPPDTKRIAAASSGGSCSALGKEPSPFQKGVFIRWEKQYCACKGGTPRDDPANGDAFSCWKGGKSTWGCSWESTGRSYQCGAQ
jgi:hypothetical protein